MKIKYYPIPKGFMSIEGADELINTLNNMEGVTAKAKHAHIKVMFNNSFTPDHDFVIHHGIRTVKMCGRIQSILTT